MRKRIRVYILSLLLCVSFMWGCKQTTVISRKDQIALLPKDTTAETEPTIADCTHITATDSWATLESTIDFDPDEESDASQSDTNGNSATSNTKPEKPDRTDPYAETEPPESTKPNESTKPVNASSVEDVTVSTESDKITPLGETTTPITPETASAPEEDPYDISCYTVGSTEYAIHAAMNAERTAAGVPELTLDETLCDIASIRAYEVSQYWSHNRLDGSSCFTILSDYGYAYATAAENLAQAGIGSDAGTYVYLWLNSECYRDNMLNPEFTRTGIGIFNHDDTTYVACLYVG